MGYRFFEEFTTELCEASAGNVIAIPEIMPSIVEPGGISLRAVCASGETTSRNSPVGQVFVSAEYLGKNCRLISEDRARSIHPRLFEYLDNVC
jgi:hypothetical protein